MMRICLDTSAYSHFKRRDEPVIDIIDVANWVSIAVRRLRREVPLQDGDAAGAVALGAEVDGEV